MDSFTFTTKQRNFFLILIGVGIISAIFTFIGDDEFHTRFWTNFLLNSVFFTGISVMALFFTAACVTAYAGWYTVFKRVWEAFSLFLPIGLVAMIIVGLGNWFGFHHIYHWADKESVANDVLLQGKASFLNSGWYLFGTVVIGGVWYFFARKMRSLSVDEDQHGDTDFSHHKKLRVFAAAFLPVGGFSTAALIWLWVMSVDAHWYSTLFGWYTAASWFVAMIALTILVMIYLQNRGHFADFNRDHLHDLGKYLFAFSIFWTYLWFSQYMLIWYGNVGEETGYFQTRIQQYPVLFYGNLLINFALPFLALLRNDTKRKNGTMTVVAALVFLGHWIDLFLMLKPGALHTAHELMGHADHGHGSEFTLGFSLPGFLEIGMMLGFLGIFLFVVFSALSNASLVPRNDPYLEESLHHHV